MFQDFLLVISPTPTTAWCSLVTSGKIVVTLAIYFTVYLTSPPVVLVDFFVESLTFQIAVKYQQWEVQHKDITETGGVTGYSSTVNQVV